MMEEFIRVLRQDSRRLGELARKASRMSRLRRIAIWGMGVLPGDRMHAERLILETDAQGQLQSLPRLPPNAKVEDSAFLYYSELAGRLIRE